MKQFPEMFKTFPAVYAVGDRYIITVAVNEPCTMWVKIGDREYFDDSNGILRTASLTHKMEVPAKILDEALEYTVCYRKVIERKPYFSELEDIKTFASSFRPIRGDNIRIFHIADAHNRVDGPVAAANAAGEHDLLILNGDIPNHSGKIEYLASIHCIAGGITKGEYPVIFSRGNHDTRGIFAENIQDHTPTDNGRSYFSVKAGPLWALVLDCGEDKPDSNAEYGYTICCEDFRKRETAFIEEVIKNAESEYLAEDVKYRLIIAHVPFHMHFGAPFNIEEERYAYWCKMIHDDIKPNLMLAGHIHQCKIMKQTPETEAQGQPCTVIAAAKPIGKTENIICGAIVMSPESAEVSFIDAEGEVYEKDIVKY